MDPFVGEIRLIPYSFAPRGWLPCDGRLLAISSNTALYSLLGVTYGGDGRTTFGLPDLRGRAVVGQGQGQGLSNYPAGLKAGAETVTLTLAQLPAHGHTLSADIPVSNVRGNANAPLNAVYAATADGNEQYGSAVSSGGNMANLLSGSTGVAGGNAAHENRMPFLVLNYCIATQGVFPSRS